MLHHQLQRVDAGRIEALVDAEYVPQEGNVLGKQRAVESLGCVRIVRSAAIVPATGLQQIDAVLSAQIVEKAAAQRTALVLHLMLGVEGDHALARFAYIAEEQLEQKALALSAVAEDEHIAVRLIGRTAK